jgi:hypothetical protein
VRTGGGIVSIDIYPHTLSPQDKRIFFEGVKKLRPQLAEMMAKDAFLQGLKDKFGAVHVFDEAEYKRLYQAGLDVIEQLKQQEKSKNEQ